MAAGSDSYVDFVLEQLAPVGQVVSARFFGGFGLTRDGKLFGMIMNDTLYFSVDDTTRPRYVAMGSTCFSYNKKDRRVDINRFYAVPAEVLEDQDQLVELARESIRITPVKQESRAKRKAKTATKAEPKAKTATKAEPKAKTAARAKTERRNTRT